MGWDEAEFQDLGLSFHERGAVSNEYLQIMKTVWANDVPSFSGQFFNFSGGTFAPRPTQQPRPPIWVGGTPGTISSPAVRRVVELGDAWHPVFLSLDDIARGIDLVRERADKVGRKAPISFAPRNLLNLAPSTKGIGRATFDGSVDEVASDIQKALALGCTYLTFDLPDSDVPGMVGTMERFANEVKPDFCLA